MADLANNNGNLIKKVLDVLEFVTTNPKASSIQSITEDTGIPASTVHRILQTMKEEGYIRQVESKRYIPTYKLLSIAGDVPKNDPMVEKVYPFMCYYASKMSCQVGLSVFYQNEAIVHLASVGSAGLYKDRFSMPGSTLPAYCTAAGKVFLSQFSDEELREWIDSNSIVPHTAYTIINPQELIEDVVKTRKQGYGIVVSELFEEIACVSIPVVNADNLVIGAVNFSTSPERFKEINNEEFISSVKEKLRKISF